MVTITQLCALETGIFHNTPNTLFLTIRMNLHLFVQFTKVFMELMNAYVCERRDTETRNLMVGIPGPLALTKIHSIRQRVIG